MPHADGLTCIDRYWLRPPYSYAAIIRNAANILTYTLVEPPLTSRELILLQETHEYLRDTVVLEDPHENYRVKLQLSDVARIIRHFDPGIPEERVGILHYYLERNFLGYGKIDGLMHDENIEDISCNGDGVPVYVYHRAHASLPTTIRFSGDELNLFIMKLAQKADKHISLTTPLVDAALPDGSRTQLTFSNVVSTRGSSFTIRKFKADPMTPLDLIAYRTYSPEVLAFLWLAVENRKSMIVVGGTASGKTSTMNAISFFIPFNAKIVSLEDTREIQLPHENWLPTQTRETTISSTRVDIDLFSLLRSALRQRPEFIIVGEVRGREAQTLFQAMNSGHTTYSTLHAGTIQEAINRLAHDPISIPRAMFGALDLIVIQSLHYRGGEIYRQCDSVHEIILTPDGEIRWSTLYENDPTTREFRRVAVRSQVLDEIAAMHGWDDETVVRQLALRERFLREGRKEEYSTATALLAAIRNLEVSHDVRKTEA
ncbi:type II/IV secretion system ATPase subunit [Methanoculleus taiwanensis]|uniref:type II/IV secretion system ATPase subunit n=1 Tax=Methanoculleus taiwanensis TaxID=1550565 RepID=UPI0013E8A622|nr:type II/IV secretion system ATPase subunit [Methanoculleus taiwanensis]